MTFEQLRAAILDGTLDGGIAFYQDDVTYSCITLEDFYYTDPECITIGGMSIENRYKIEYRSDGGIYLDYAE